MSFFQALQQMDHLTSLEFMVTSERDKHAFAESMPSLTGLRSLVLSSAVNIPDTSSEITRRLTILTQLTRLCLSGLPGGQSLRFPTGIIDLHLTRQPVFSEDLVGELVDLTNLTSLKISSFENRHLFHPGNVTPLHFFKELRQLKALTLWNVYLDRPFLEAFVALTGLTKLSLDERYEQMDHEFLCRQLRLLSNLRVLMFPFPIQLLVDSQTEAPQEFLPKLRKLRGYYLRDAIEGDPSALVKAFPCLRDVG